MAVRNDDEADDGEEADGQKCEKIQSEIIKFNSGQLALTGNGFL